LKHILPFLLLITACVQPAHQPTTLFKEQLIRNDTTNPNTVILRKLVNNQPIEITNIADSILYFSQENQKTDTISFYNSLFGFNSNTDLNNDGFKELIIYGHHNMHGQRQSYVFLSDKTGRLHYRPELSLPNLVYDSITKHIISYYIGGVYSEHSKFIYIWDKDSLRLIRGATIQFNSPHTGYVLKFFEGNVDKPYKTIQSSEEPWDTAIFKDYPEPDITIEL